MTHEFGIPEHIKIAKGRRRKSVDNALYLLGRISIQRIGSDDVDTEAAGLIHECFEYLVEVGYFEKQFGN